LGKDLLQEAAEWGKLAVLQKLREWATERQTTDERNKKLLFVRDHNGCTVWYRPSHLLLPNSVQKLWEWAKEKLTTEEITNELFLATDVGGKIRHRQTILSASDVLAKEGKIIL
jgi:hypothetical protein